MWLPDFIRQLPRRPLLLRRARFAQPPWPYVPPITVRPDLGRTAPPDAGTTVRPSTGTTASPVGVPAITPRPFTGITAY